MPHVMPHDMLAMIALAGVVGALLIFALLILAGDRLLRALRLAAPPVEEAAYQPPPPAAVRAEHEGTTPRQRATARQRLLRLGSEARSVLTDRREAEDLFARLDHLCALAGSPVYAPHAPAASAARELAQRVLATIGHSQERSDVALLRAFGLPVPEMPAATTTAGAPQAPYAAPQDTATPGAATLRPGSRQPVPADEATIAAAEITIAEAAVAARTALAELRQAAEPLPDPADARQRRLLLLLVVALVCCGVTLWLQHRTSASSTPVPQRGTP